MILGILKWNTISDRYMFMYVSDLLDTQSTKNNLSYYIPEKTF